MNRVGGAPSGNRVDVSTIVLVVGAVLVALLFLGAFFVFRIFTIPSGSNIPTLVVGDYVISSKLAYGLVATYKETLPDGASYTIIEIQGDTGFNDNTDELLVPPGQYFTLGDNRDNSLDSRVAPDQGGVGMVPYDNFISRAEYVLFSPGRPGRAMSPIR